jgi:hypothetical protein
MATMNLLTGSWDGKLGKTVGQKWKNKHVIKAAADGKVTPSPAQTKALLVFGVLQRVIRQLQVQIQPGIYHPSPKMTIQNLWVHHSKAAIAGGIFNPGEIRGPQGTLATFQNVILTYNKTTGNLHGERNTPAGWNDPEAKIIWTSFWHGETLLYSFYPQPNTSLTYTFNIGAGIEEPVWSTLMWQRTDRRTKRYSQLVAKVATVITGIDPIDWKRSEEPKGKLEPAVDSVLANVLKAPKPRSRKKKVIDTPEGV